MPDDGPPRWIALAALGGATTVSDAVVEHPLPLDVGGQVLVAVCVLLVAWSKRRSDETATASVLGGGACCIAAVEIASLDPLGTALFLASGVVLLVGAGLVGRGLRGGIGSGT